MEPSSASRTTATPQTPLYKSMRRFGTVLSVNSPAPRSSVKKKARLRTHSAHKRRHSSSDAAATATIPEETIVFDSSSNNNNSRHYETYSVTFDAGPIGLKIDPDSGVILSVHDGASPARVAGSIAEGDAIQSVNQVGFLESKEDAMNILQNTESRRTLVFERRAPAPNADGRKPRAKFSSLLSSPLRSIHFDADLSNVQTEKEEDEEPGEVSMFQSKNLLFGARVPSILSAEPSKGELQLTQRDLDGATQLLDQLQEKLAAVEHENELLRGDNTKQYGSSGAIKEMEYKMRISALDEELKTVRQSKSHLKERVQSLEQQLANQSRKDRTALEVTQKELKDVLSQLKEAMDNLENTRKEFEAAKAQWSNKNEDLKQQNDKLSEILEQQSSSIERNFAARKQEELRVQQLEQAKAALEEELRQARQQLQDASAEAAQSSKVYLDSIREKDGQIDELRHELVSTQRENATLQSDASANESSLRKASADLEHVTKEKNALSSELSHMSTLFKEALRDKEQVEAELAKTTEKLTNRNTEIEQLKKSAKSQREDLRSEIESQKEAMTEAANSIDSLYQEKERLLQQVSDLRSAALGSSKQESELRVELEALRKQCTSLKSSNTAEKCDFLKRIEELEGELLEFRDAIKRKDLALAKAQTNLDGAYAESDRLADALETSERKLTNANDTINRMKAEMCSMEEAAAAERQSYENNIGAMESDLNARAQTINKLNIEKSGMGNKIKEMEGALESANVDKQSIATELESVRDQLAEIQISSAAEREELHCTVDAMKLQLKRSEQLVLSTKNDLSHSRDQLRSANSEIKRLTKSYQRVKSDLDAAANQIIEKDAHFAAFKARSKQEQDELREGLNAKLIHLTASTSAAMKSLESQKSTAMDQLKELKSVLGKTSEQKSQLQNDLEESKIELDRLSTALSKSEVTVKELTDAIESKCAEFDALIESSEAKEYSLVTQIEACNKELSELFASKQALDATNCSLLSRTEELEALLEATTHEKTTLQTELKRMSDAITTSEAAFDGEKKNLQMAVDSSRQQLKQSEERAASTKEDLLSALDKLDSAESEIERLSNSLSQCKADLAAATARIVESEQLLEEHKSSAAQQHEKLHEDLTTKIRNVTESSSETIQILEAKKNDLSEQIETLRSSLQDSSATESKLRDDLDAAKEEMGRLANALALTEHKLLDLTNTVKSQDAQITTEKRLSAKREEALKSKVSSQAEQIEVLSRSQAGLTAEKEALEIQVEQLAKEMEHAAALKLEDEAVILSAKEQLTKLTATYDTEKAAMQKSIEDLQSELRQRLHLVEVTKAKLESAGSELRNAESEIERLSTGCTRAESDLEEAKNRLVEQEKKLKEETESEIRRITESSAAEMRELESQNMLLTTEIEKLRKAVKDSSDRENQYRDELALVQSDLSERTALASEEYSKLQISLNNLERQLEESQSQNDANKGDLSKALAELASSETSLKKVTADLWLADDNYLAATKTIEEQNELLESTRRSTAAQENQLRSEVELANKKLSEAMQTIERLEAEAAVLEKAKSDLSDALQSAETSKSGIAKQVDDLLKERNATEQNFLAKVSAMESEMAKATVLVEAKSSELATMERSLQEQKMSLESASATKEDRIHQLTAENDELSKKILELRIRVEKSNEAESVLKRDVENLRLELSKTEADFENSQSLMELQKNELHETIAQLDIAKSDCEELSSKLKLSEKDLESMSRQLDSSTQQVAALKEAAAAKRRKIEKETDEKDKALEDFHNTAQSLRWEKEDLEKQLRVLTSKLDSSQANESSLRENADKYRSELSAAQSSAQAKESALSHQIEILKLELKDTEDLVEKKHSTIVSITDDLSAARSEIGKLSSEAAKLRSDLQDSKSKINVLGSTAEESRIREARLCSEAEENLKTKAAEFASAADARVSEILSELSELQKKLKSQEEMNANVCKQNTLLKENVDTFSTKIVELESSVNAKKEAAAVLQEKLQDRDHAFEKLKRDFQQKTDDLVEREDDLQRAQLEVSQLKEHIAKLVSESSQSKQSQSSHIIALEEELSKISKDNTEMEALVRSLGKSAADSESQLTTVRKELQFEKEALKQLRVASDATQKHLEKEIYSLSSEAERYRELSNQLNDECNELKMDYESLDDRVERLKKSHFEEVSQLQGKVAEVSEREKHLRDQLASEKENSRAVSDELRSVKHEKEIIVQNTDALQRRQVEEIRILKYDTELKAKRHAEWIQERDAERDEYRKCQESLSEARSDIARKEECLKQLQDKFDDVSDRLEQLEDEHTSKMSNLSISHATKVDHLSKERDSLDASLEKMVDEKQDLLSRFSEVESKLHSSKSELERSEKEKKEVSNALQEAKDTIVELQHELDGLQNASIDSGSIGGSPLKGLSKHELKSRYTVLQDELSQAEDRVATANNNASRRSERVDRLSADLDAMSAEISSLVEANESLERCVRELRTQNEASDAYGADAREKLGSLELESSALKEEVETLTKKNDAISKQLQTSQEKADSEKQDLLSRASTLEKELSEATRKLGRLEEDKNDGIVEIAAMRNQLANLSTEHESSYALIRKMESDLAEANSAIVVLKDEKDADQIDFHRKNKQLEQQVAILEAERCAWQKTSADLEVEIETTKRSILQAENDKQTLSDRIEKQREEISAAEKSREDAVLRLGEASKVVAQQKHDMVALENRASEAESNVTSMSDKVRTLLEQVQKMEAFRDEKGRLHQKQIQELECNYRKLEGNLSDAKAEADTLRENLRVARREKSEATKMGEDLQSRLNAAKSSLESAKTQLHQARTAAQVAKTSNRNLECEVDGKQMEVDHLKAKVQVLTATSARLKAELLLARESSYQFDKASTKSGNQNEVTELKAQLKAKSDKHESLSEVYFSQQQVLTLSQSLEGQLVRFIEDILSQTGGIFNKISGQSEKLYEFVDRLSLENGIQALDLAGFEHSENTLASFRAILDKLSLLVPDALAQLEERREQLELWKQQKSNRPTASQSLSTPKSKQRTVVPDTPAILESFQRMKSVLNDEILSPNKLRTDESNRRDIEHLKKIILSLEGQIDVLLMDLETANEALRAKDMLISDLEDIAIRHESERISLDEQVTELDERLQQAEKKNAQLRDGQAASPGSESSHMDPKACKLAAGRLLIHALDGRSNAAKAVAFRQWACQTSALHAVAKQGQAAAALARQLEETREKLIILKRHLKKTRRAPRDSGLGSIAEHTSEI